MKEHRQPRAEYPLGQPLPGQEGMPYLLTLAFLDAVVSLITGQVLC